MEEASVVGMETLYAGFEQAFARWQKVEKATIEPTRTFVPLFEVLQWSSCIDERLKLPTWAPDLRGLRWARHRVYHDWALALEVRSEEDLRLEANVVREGLPALEWAWRDELPNLRPSKATHPDEPFYAKHLAGYPARVTLNLVHALFLELRGG